MIASMTNRRTANKAPNPENEPILVILAILLLGALSIYATRHRFDQRTTISIRGQSHGQCSRRGEGSHVAN